MTCSVLMVAYYYPPRGGGGVQRTVKFAKYLPEFGIRPVVLTCGGAPRHLRDTTFLVAQDVVSVPFREPGRIIGRLNEYLRLERISGWARPAIKAALATVHEQGIEAIYSTASPYTNHVVARAVARELGLPWIVDFRDLWTTNALYTARTPWLAKRHRALEDSLYKEANVILATSPYQKKSIVDTFGVDSAKVRVITNGFDPADFLEDPTTANQPPSIVKKNAPVKIGYLGSLYAAYKPDDLILALRFIKRRWPERMRELSFEFIGDYDRSSNKVLRDPELQSILKVRSYVPHGELPALRRSFDGFLLYLPALGDGIKGMIPQKVFEYLATRKPIFAIVPPSDVADLLKAHQAAVLAPAGDPIGIARALLEFVEMMRSDSVPRAQGSLEGFSRKVLTRQLADVIEELI